MTSTDADGSPSPYSESDSAESATVRAGVRAVISRNNVPTISGSAAYLIGSVISQPSRGTFSIVVAAPFTVTLISTTSAASISNTRSTSATSCSSRTKRK